MLNKQLPRETLLQRGCSDGMRRDRETHAGAKLVEQLILPRSLRFSYFLALTRQAKKQSRGKLLHQVVRLISLGIYPSLISPLTPDRRTACF